MADGPGDQNGDSEKRALLRARWLAYMGMEAADGYPDKLVAFVEDEVRRAVDERLIALGVIRPTAPSAG